MSGYAYNVWRLDNGVFYSINLDGVMVVGKREVENLDLSFIYGRCNGEKEVGRKLEFAHILAKKAISNLIKYEKR
tara:strand:+ start:536 stop:760 length:225 start_codon:yes stop_codon:yes gene_type:complete